MDTSYSSSSPNYGASDTTCCVDPSAVTAVPHPFFVDAGQLRRVLRAIHCLQKERGASCAAVCMKWNDLAGVDCDAEQEGAAGLHKARYDTDRALERCVGNFLACGGGGGNNNNNSNNHSTQRMEEEQRLVQITLHKIRKLLDRNAPQPTVGNPTILDDVAAVAADAATGPRLPSVGRLLVSYSTLIFAILHEYVIRHTMAQQQQQQQQQQPAPPSGSCVQHQKSGESSIEAASAGAGNEGTAALTRMESLPRRNGDDESVGTGDQQHLQPVVDPPPTSPASASGYNLHRVHSVGSLKQQHDRVVAAAAAANADDGSDNRTKKSRNNHRSKCMSDMDAVLLEKVMTSADNNHGYCRVNSGLSTSTGSGGARGAAAAVITPKSSKANLLPRLDSEVSMEPSLNSVTDLDMLCRDEYQVYTSIEQNYCRQMNLLALLEVFVRLKESNGVERASLISIFVSGSAHNNQDEASRLLNDVAIEVENQRRLLDELSSLPPGPLRNLVQELIAMSPEMRQLQDSVLKGLSLDSLRQKYNSNALWDLMTVYIDKLHSLELLILEEIEFCTPYNNNHNNKSTPTTGGAATAATSSTTATSSNLGGPPTPSYPNLVNNNQGPVSTAAIGASVAQASEADVLAKTILSEAFGIVSDGPGDTCAGGFTPEDLLKTIQSMSSAEIKKRMMAVLRKEPSIHAQERYSKKGVDELLDELCNAPTPKEWEIDIYELRFLKRIGQGSAGTTYVADWSGLKVAVKVASITEMGLEGWRTEVQSLQKLHHPNIIRLLGSVYHAHPLTFCLVLEFCDGGDLESALQKVTPPGFFFHVSQSIAKGLNYLHNRSIIHRDVKPSNMLIQGEMSSGNYQIKVTDFGVATVLDTVREKTAETGTYRWMAPEVIRHEAYTETADVYSYAILVWQLLTREEPFADRSQIQAAVAVSMESARPPLPVGMPIQLKGLMEQCWCEDPLKRPSFEEIVDSLGEIEKCMNTEEKAWLDSPLGHPVYSRREDECTADAAEEELKIPNLRHLDAATGNRNKGVLVQPREKKKGLRGIFQRKSSHF